MGRSGYLPFLLISVLLLHSFSSGLGRKVTETIKNDESYTAQSEENSGLSKEIVELDYVEAGPNTNTRSGHITPPSPTPPAP